MGASPHERDRHVVVGRVQGVGFRPFVYRLATDLNLAGFAQNAPEGVVIEVQGPRSDLDAFARQLAQTLPPLAMIVKHDRKTIPAIPENLAFNIRESVAGQGHHVLVSPDIATCPQCLADMADPKNRRHLYPFTNCTNCGPRYTITKSLPYDRATTSMACFALCPECQAEYDDPRNRRFHAQPNACPVCGPHVWFTDRSGRELSSRGEAVTQAAKMLLQGKIVALKGLGGFHLAASATDHIAVAELRRRKTRPAKPLAVMVPDLETLRRFATPGDEEVAMLAGNERPIVLVPLREDSPLSPLVSPDTDQLGVMLPYTPLHHALFRALARLGADLAALVMTSGNLSGDPIALGNREALSRLGAIADFFLLHNRDILVRADDSVVRFLHANRRTKAADPPASLQFLRRARGFTPQPVFLPKPGPCVLGVGAHLKNTICITKDDQAFLSQHIGDLENLETAAFHAEVIAHLTRIMQVAPKAVVADLHPDYLSTRWALEQSGLPVIRLQHHFAHIFAGLAGNGLTSPVLGIALDGSGLGDNQTIWGGEFLYVDPTTLAMRRVGHFSPMRLPGGDKAIKEPWRMAFSCLKSLGRDPLNEGWTWLKGRERAAGLVAAMIDKELNSPMTTSCGRLFDAVSALAGLCPEISYEGQAAIRLEHTQDRTEDSEYACPLIERAEPAVLDTLSLFGQAADDLLAGAPASIASRRFHLGLTSGLADAAATLCAKLGTRHVVLSGGVFLNRTVATRLPELLAARGLIPHAHTTEPPGDGCIALGQAYFGQLMLERAASEPIDSVPR